MGPGIGIREREPRNKKKEQEKKTKPLPRTTEAIPRKNLENSLSLSIFLLAS